MTDIKLDPASLRWAADFVQKNADHCAEHGDPLLASAIGSLASVLRKKADEHEESIRICDICLTEIEQRKSQLKKLDELAIQVDAIWTKLQAIEGDSEP